MSDREKVVKALEQCTRGQLRRKADKYVVTLDIRLVNSILELLKEHEEVKAEDAEMAVTHNDGTVEYIKDIADIMLLAHKDYGITYCGVFSEGGFCQ